MKRLRFLAILLMALLLAPWIVSAQEDLSEMEQSERSGEKEEEKAGSTVMLEEIVVTATTIEGPSERDEMGATMTVIWDVPGLDVVQTGGPGRTASVYIRGSRPEHTLVLIDGVEMNDPMSPGRSYDFGYLTTDNIERIEILRGPQSTIYGSDAMGGVVNIITKKGKAKPEFFISGEAGSFNTYRESLGAGGANRWANFSIGASHTESDGISASNKQLKKKGGGHGFMDKGSTHTETKEKDSYENTSVSARLGITPAKEFEIDFTYRYIDASGDLDDHAGAGGEDPNYMIDSRQYFFRTEAALFLFDGLWDQRLGYSISDHNRIYINEADELHHLSQTYGSTYDGNGYKLDWRHTLELHETNTLILGLETEKENAEYNYYSDSHWGRYVYEFAKENARTTSYYFRDQIELWKSFFTTAGIRIERHNKFGSKATYRIAPGYLFKKTGTVIKASYGTGFKVPSLFQLYSLWGREDLKPEESKGWDVGIEQPFFQNVVRVGLTYFRNDFENLIDYNYWKGYVNIAEAMTRGVEVFILVEPLEDLTIVANYTYTQTRDKKTEKKLLRRPENKGSLNVNYRFLEKGNINLGVVYVGERDDWVPWPRRGQVDSYTVVNVAGSFDITKNFKVFGRVENILDEEYEEVWGYGTQTRFISGGLKISF
jgi:vitamin B12 transporter